jgi:cytochrome P450
LIPGHVKLGAKDHYALTKQTAMRRIESRNTEREDFMSYILRHNEDKGGVSVPEIVANSGILILAGSETTATLLSGATFNLLKNRPVYDKLVAEIRSSFASEQEVTLERVSQLPYLLAVLNESLRMYPPVPSSLSRTCPSGGDFVEGFWIPEKTTVSAPHWSAFKSARNFRNPEKFHPERWLGDEEYGGDAKEVLQPFSMGPRNCIGKNLAYAEMRLLLVRLLWKFNIEMMSESRDWDRQGVYSLWEKGELRVKLTETRTVE